ncbi:hypothetical protein ABG067_002119 [Albugo candida]
MKDDLPDVASPNHFHQAEAPKQDLRAEPHIKSLLRSEPGYRAIFPGTLVLASGAITDLGFFIQDYLPVIIKVLGRTLGQHGFAESSRGLCDFVKLLGDVGSNQTDPGILQELIALRKVLTPTGKWVANDRELEDKKEHTRKEELPDHLFETVEDNIRNELTQDTHVNSDKAAAQNVTPVIVSSPPRKLVVSKGDRVRLEVRAKHTRSCQWFCNGKVVCQDLREKAMRRQPNALIIPSFGKHLIGDYTCRCSNGKSYSETTSCHVTLAKFHATQVATLNLSGQPHCDLMMVSLYPSRGANCVPIKAIALCLRGSLCFYEQNDFSKLHWLTVNEHSKVDTIERLRCISLDENSNLMILAKSSEIILTSLELLRPNSCHSEKDISEEDRSSSTVCVNVLRHVALRPSCPESSSNDLRTNSIQFVQFIARGNFILVSDMYGTILIYSVDKILKSIETACIHQIHFSNQKVCGLHGSAHAPLFTVCFDGTNQVKVFEIRKRRNFSDINPNQYSLMLCQKIQLKLNATSAFLDDYGFHIAVEEYSCLKSWLSIHSLRKRPMQGSSAICGSRKRIFAHDGRISTIKWLTQWSGWVDLLVSAGCSDGYVRFWDFERNTCLYQFNLHERGISRFQVRTDGLFYCLLYKENQVTLIRLKAWKKLHKTRLRQKYDTAAKTIHQVWKGFCVRRQIRP